ncbi:uncharacterized protein C4orf36 homolog [Emydura macquarii macquarii]|uniref:uncharacterized protein C4orf36 homolog n=1 Tax=Emydura macquarii macquarii TaxID=1129001 RepID=UPI00352AE28B
MEYDFHRKRTVKSVLQASCYKVVDAAELALLTRSLLQEMGQPHLSFLEDIPWCHTLTLQPAITVERSLFPSVQTLEIERIFESKRLNKIDLENKIVQQTEFDLKGKIIGARQPLSPF